MSINVGTEGTTHNITISRTYELQIDVLLVQGRTEAWFSEQTEPATVKGFSPGAEDAEKLSYVQARVVKTG